MAKDFNINDFLGGGSSSNFGNFGDTSSAADLFAADVFTPAPSNTPSNAFAIDQFQDYSFNSPQVDASLLGYQGSPGNFQSIQTPSFGGGFLGQSSSPFSPPSFSSLNSQMQQAAAQNSNPYINNGKSFEQNASDLLFDVEWENTDLDIFQENLAPRISSEPGPGLEPFNRFNPTTSQFEQFFGNRSARLPSAETFIQGETGFNDTPRFLESIRAEAQRNAQNFIGNPVTEAQLRKAAELNSLMGSPSSNFGTIDGNLSKAEYGNQNGPTDFEPRTVEEMNALLKMRTNQQAAAQRDADNKYVRGPEFQKAMAEMKKPFLESKAAYDRASLLSQNELKNRLPFNTPFNRDKDGNKFAAGRDADEQSLAQYKKQAAAMYGGKGENRLRGKDLDNAARALRDADRKARIDDERSAVAVKTFLDDNNIGRDLTPKGILAGIEAAGSPEAFVRMYANLQSQMSAAQNKKLDESTEGMARYGAKLKDSTLMKSRDSNETLMMGQNMDTGQWGTVGQDGVFKPEDITKWSPTSSANVKDARNKAMELQTGIFEESGGVGALEAFKKSREMSQEGFAGLVTDIRGKVQNFVGQDLDPQAMRNAVAQAGFQALLGEIRIDVLGPGVLTEIDAQRLIEAMGGYGSTSDRETSLELIQQLINKKKRTLDGKMTVYDQYRTTFDTLENELPFISADNIERVRMGDFGRNKNINNTVNINSLFNP